jgi:hypothetical protein
MRWRFAGLSSAFRPFGAGNPSLRDFQQNRLVFRGAFFRQAPALGGILAIFFHIIHRIHQYRFVVEMPEMGTWNFPPKFRIKSAGAGGNQVDDSRVPPRPRGER